jgi:hypothetical protein
MATFAWLAGISTAVEKLNEVASVTFFLGMPDFAPRAFSFFR